MSLLSVLGGATKYEFRMQVRRLALWITFPLLGLILSQFHQPWFRPISTPAASAIIYWTTEMHSILAIAVGILLADRLFRDRRTRTEEILQTYSGSLFLRLLGKYLGSTLATLLPVLVVYSIGVGYIIFRWHDAQVLPLAIATFIAIVLPGIFFVGAFSIAVPALMWVPLYQFLFVGYWFWGNLLPGVGIPTLSETLLTPVGSATCTGLFNQAHLEGVCSPGLQGITPLQGIESILLLLCLAMLVMIVLPGYLKWQQARQ